jgi:hypothetical protein
MDDLVFTQEAVFKSIKVKSALLPGSGVVYEMAEFDVRYPGWWGRTEGRARKVSLSCRVSSVVFKM